MIFLKNLNEGDKNKNKIIYNFSVKLIFNTNRNDLLQLVIRVKQFKI